MVSWPITVERKIRKMALTILLLTPLITLCLLSLFTHFQQKGNSPMFNIKFIGLFSSTFNLFVCLTIFINFDFSYNQFQFIQEYHNMGYCDFYLGLDNLSIYFVLLTCIIFPISLLSNWTSISVNVKSYVIIILLLETLLLLVFMVLDMLLFYIFFESILSPLFILIGLYGSSNKVRASFYLFLYTLIGSLFLLLSIVTISSITGTTDFDCLSKTNFNYYTQLVIFYGIFLSFAVKTPTIFLNNWLLKAHVESPLGGSLILASIVLKLSLYGVIRLILPILPKAHVDNTHIVFIIGILTIIYASLATLRTVDMKELVAYSSVSHAAVYLLGVFSNNIQGIEGAIIFGLAHGFVSSGLFICVGGVLYDRSGNRLITIYRGMAQIMPVFSILFFILCLANAGAPLTFNFIGEFMCLYGTFERLPLLGIIASTSIVLSAAYSMFMFNRISFGGSVSKLFLYNVIDLTKREFFIISVLIMFTVVLGIYPIPVLNGLHYGATNLIYSSEYIYYFLLPPSFFSKLKSNSKYIKLKKIIMDFFKFFVSTLDRSTVNKIIILFFFRYIIRFILKDVLSINNSVLFDFLLFYIFIFINRFVKHYKIDITRFFKWIKYIFNKPIIIDFSSKKDTFSKKKIADNSTPNDNHKLPKISDKEKHDILIYRYKKQLHNVYRMIINSPVVHKLYNKECIINKQTILYCKLDEELRNGKVTLESEDIEKSFFDLYMFKLKLEMIETEYKFKNISRQKNIQQDQLIDLTKRYINNSDKDK